MAPQHGTPWLGTARHTDRLGSARLGTARLGAEAVLRTAPLCPLDSARLRSISSVPLQPAPLSTAPHCSEESGEARGACASLTPHTVKYKSTL